VKRGLPLWEQMAAALCAGATIIVLVAGCEETRYAYLPTPPCPADSVTVPADSTICDSLPPGDCHRHHCRHRHHQDCKGP